MLFTDWNQVLGQLANLPDHEIVSLPKWPIPHPLHAGAVEHVGLPRGQSADYRWKLRDCRGLHVQDFGDHWEAHIDLVDPRCDLVGHIEKDVPPAVIVSIVVAAVAAIALAFLSD